MKKRTRQKSIPRNAGQTNGKQNDKDSKYAALLDPIKLGYHDWKVLKRNDYRCDDGAEVMGQTDIDCNIIYVDDQYGDKATKSTLMHEALHACFSHNSIENFDDEQEERVVTFLSDRLMNLFENDHLRKYLFE